MEGLPDEVVLHVFESLSIKDCISVCLVCTRWKLLVLDEHLWRRHHEIELGTRCSLGTTWWESYKSAKMQLKEYEKLDVGWGFYETRAFYFAISSGLDTLTIHLLDTRPSLLCSGYAGYATPIHAATASGHVSVLELLLDRCPDFDLQRHARSLIEVACSKGGVEVLEFLLTQKGITLTHDSCYNPPSWLPSSREALAAAARKGQTEVIRALVKHGAAVEYEHISQAITSRHEQAALTLGMIYFQKTAAGLFSEVVLYNDYFATQVAYSMGWQPEDWDALYYEYTIKMRATNTNPHPAILKLLKKHKTTAFCICM